MKKKHLSLACAVLSLSILASCVSGPRRLQRSFDDWTNQKYAENSWLHGALLQDILPVYPIVGFFCAFGDWLVLNPYYFWSEDAWDGKGTAFDHESVSGAERSVSGPGF